MSLLQRRSVMKFLAVGSAAWVVPGAFAEELARTPRMTEGPFYPDKLPLDTDNDLLVLNDSITPAVGTITHLYGKVTDLKGNPLRGCTVEIWQCDNAGVYLHSRSGGNVNKKDKNFQGFGRCLTNMKGEYAFRTIKPVPYPGRTPHIHIIVKKGDRRLLTTQIFNRDEKKRNDQDGLLRQLNAQERALLIADFKEIKNSRLGELAAQFNVVVGLTPADPKE